MPAKIMPCKCAHKSQDQLHGAGLRVFNQTRESEGKVYRCSVCLSTKSVGGEADTKKKGK